MVENRITSGMVTMESRVCMEVVREFDRDKLFVILGMRSFFGDGKVELFLKASLAHGYRILLLDCIARDKLPHEKRLTIDNDLCEF